MLNKIYFYKYLLPVLISVTFTVFVSLAILKIQFYYQGESGEIVRLEKEKACLSVLREELVANIATAIDCKKRLPNFKNEFKKEGFRYFSDQLILEMEKLSCSELTGEFSRLDILLRFQGYIYLIHLKNNIMELKEASERNDLKRWLYVIDNLTSACNQYIQYTSQEIKKIDEIDSSARPSETKNLKWRNTMEVMITLAGWSISIVTAIFLFLQLKQQSRQNTALLEPCFEFKPHNNRNVYLSNSGHRIINLEAEIVSPNNSVELIGFGESGTDEENELGFSEKFNLNSPVLVKIKYKNLANSIRYQIWEITYLPKQIYTFELVKMG
jgi:hypothetical protein